MSDLPHGWNWATIGSVAESLVDGPFGSNLKTEHYQSSGVRVIRLQNIADGQFNDNVKAYISEEHAKSLNRHDARPGDVLIASMGDILPRVCLVPRDVNRAIVKADCFRLRPREGVLPQFLAYMLSAPQTRKEASTQIAGVGRPRLNLNKVSRLTIPIPPKQEQAQIVAAIEEQFSRLDSGLANLTTAHRNLTLMHSAVFEEALTKPARENFPRVRFGDLLREPLRNGYSAKAALGGTVPVISLGAVTSGNFGTSNLKMTAADPWRVRDLWLQPGDLLVERSNTRELVGTACLFRGEPNFAVYPDLIIRARVDDNIIPEYAELALKAPSSRRYFQQRAQGISGNMPKIDQRTIEELELPLPSLEIQTEIVCEAERKLTLMRSLREALELASKRSSRLRASILAAAFSGDLIFQSIKEFAG